METESHQKGAIYDYLPVAISEMTLKDVGLAFVYFLGIAASIIGIVLLTLMIASTGPFPCNFPSGSPLENSALSESLDAIQLSYEKANDFALFRRGLVGTPLDNCFHECAIRTCYIPELGEDENCKVSCSSYGKCINQCELCDRKVATQAPSTSATCMNLEDCGHFGFK